MICDDCIHQWECWEQRGQCREFVSREEIRRQIEMLNKTYKSATYSMAGNEAVSRSDDMGRGRGVDAQGRKADPDI